MGQGEGGRLAKTGTPRYCPRPPGVVFIPPPVHEGFELILRWPLSARRSNVVSRFAWPDQGHRVCATCASARAGDHLECLVCRPKNRVDCTNMDPAKIALIHTPWLVSQDLPVEGGL